MHGAITSNKSVATNRVIIHPLYNRIKALVDKNIRNDIVLHSVFNGIRNRGELENILTKMGFVPNTRYGTTSWARASKKYLRGLALKEAKQWRVMQEPDALTAIEQARILQTELLEPRINVRAKIIDTLAKKEPVRSDFMDDKPAFHNAIHGLRNKGFSFNVKQLADGGMTYQLTGNDAGFKENKKGETLTELVKADFRTKRVVYIKDYPNADSLRNAICRLKNQGLRVENIIDETGIIGFKLKYL